MYQGEILVFKCIVLYFNLLHVCVHIPLYLLMYCIYLTSTFPQQCFFHNLRVSDFPVDLGNPKSDWNKTLIPLITVCFFKLDLLNLRVPDPISFKSLEARPSADAALCKMLSKNLICHMSSNLIHKTNLH